MSKTAVLVDSGADISIAEEEKYSIHVLRMPIIVDDKEYIEGKDITHENLHEMLSAGKLAKTAQSSPGEIQQILSNLLKDYENVLYIPLSSGLSGQYLSSATIAKEFDGKVVVVDAKTVCSPLLLCAIDAKRMLDEGRDILEVKEIIESQENLDAVILPYDLNYLKMGGRISAAAASLANLFKIVPMLEVKDGQIDVLDKVRTQKRAIERGIEHVASVDNFSGYYWMIIHDHRDEDVEYLSEKFKETVKEEIIVRNFGAVILSHTGPKTLAFGRIRKIK